MIPITIWNIIIQYYLIYTYQAVYGNKHAVYTTSSCNFVNFWVKTNFVIYLYFVIVIKNLRSIHH